MRLRQNKSKWEVVCDDGHRVYASYKNRRATEEKLALLRAYCSLANGWGRCTPEQRRLLEADMRSRGRWVEPYRSDDDLKNSGECL